MLWRRAICSCKSQINVETQRKPLLSPPHNIYRIIRNLPPRPVPDSLAGDVCLSKLASRRRVWGLGLGVLYVASIPNRASKKETMGNSCTIAVKYFWNLPKGLLHALKSQVLPHVEFGGFGLKLLARSEGICRALIPCIL